MSGLSRIARALSVGAASFLVLATAVRSQSYETSLAPEPTFQNHFGRALGLSGNTLAVGTPYSPGAVYIYVHDSGAWSLQAAVPSPNVQEGGEFGEALALDGDTLLVGAWGTSDPGFPSPGAQRGAAYVFQRSGLTWTQQSLLQPPAVHSLDQFGRAVALDGDVAVVGAPFADPSGESSGRAWVFRRQGSQWIEEASLAAVDGGAGQRFGGAVTVSGATVVVGADLADGAAPRAGAAYVYAFNGSAWLLQQKIVATTGVRDDRFGQSLSLHGDELAVGVPRRDPGGVQNAGAVAIFLRAGTSWTQEAWLAAPAGHMVDNLGISVALQGNVLLAGAPDDDEAAPMGGAAFTFRRSGGTWGFAAKLLSPVTTSGDAVGVAVALDGDLGAVGTDNRWHLPLLPSAKFGAADIWTGMSGGSP